MFSFAGSIGVSDWCLVSFRLPDMERLQAGDTYLWGLEGVVRWEVNSQEEDSSSVW